MGSGEKPFVHACTATSLVQISHPAPIYLFLTFAQWLVLMQQSVIGDTW